ncbi:hypothetical protein AKJ51_01650 [candidate division MSBL1 archaeon SCGC-AAA382A20]|uniref:Uncharacterized protein n=1 Tax=candidate division MSBL1 archaeon SCGC-AAA382A20 TaxID=1698280 RepID=A0A133VLK5_9EURY|nr:hypothetical protein AKJ51_01650 [candidate division MSBL1 archaeon SCGC-AAA382A20]
MRTIVEACELQESCAFFQKAENMGGETEAGAFLDIYCRGPEGSECVIKGLADELGWNVVPDNMMPNGNPIPGTGGEGEWPDEVKRAVGP